MGCPMFVSLQRFRQGRENDVQGCLEVTPLTQAHSDQWLGVFVSISSTSLCLHPQKELRPFSFVLFGEADSALAYGYMECTL